MKDKRVLWAVIACLSLINLLAYVIIFRDRTEIARLRRDLAARCSRVCSLEHALRSAGSPTIW